MRLVIGLAVIVFLAFSGMVIMREKGRRAESGDVATSVVTYSTDRTATISHGETVKLGDHLAPDKWTVIEFSADWCPACRQLGPQIETLTMSKADVNLRRIDIRAWGSQVAKQFGVRKLPTLWLYKGKERVATDTRDVLKRISKLQ